MLEDRQIAIHSLLESKLRSVNEQIVDEICNRGSSFAILSIGVEKNQVHLYFARIRDLAAPEIESAEVLFVVTLDGRSNMFK